MHAYLVGPADLPLLEHLERVLDEEDEEEAEHDDELSYRVVNGHVVGFLDLVQNVVNRLPDVGKQIHEAGGEKDAAGVAGQQSDDVLASGRSGKACATHADDADRQQPEDKGRDEHHDQEDDLVLQHCQSHVEHAWV